MERIGVTRRPRSGTNAQGGAEGEPGDPPRFRKPAGARAPERRGTSGTEWPPQARDLEQCVALTEGVPSSPPLLLRSSLLLLRLDEVTTVRFASALP